MGTAAGIARACAICAVAAAAIAVKVMLQPSDSPDEGLASLSAKPVDFVNLLTAHERALATLQRQLHRHESDARLPDEVRSRMRWRLNAQQQAAHAHALFFRDAANVVGAGEVEMCDGGGECEGYDTPGTLLVHIARDWSAAGQEGHDSPLAAYERVVQTTVEALGQSLSDRPGTQPLRVLVPGAGLGRLAWQLARATAAEVFAVECSHALAWAAATVLNVKQAGEWRLSPFLTRTSYVFEGDETDQVRPVTRHHAHRLACCAVPHARTRTHTQFMAVDVPDVCPCCGTGGQVRSAPRQAEAAAVTPCALGRRRCAIGCILCEEPSPVPRATHLAQHLML